MLILNIKPEHSKLLAKQTPEENFAWFMSLEGERFKAQKRRDTFKVILDGKNYFIKKHYGVGWREIFKNLFALKLPIISAKQEWLALEHLEKLKIPAAKNIAWGEKGLNPAEKESFILTEEITDFTTLENFCKNWQTLPNYIQVKRSLIKAVAITTKKMHEGGMNHRDYYTCHLLLKNHSLQQPILYIMDLHRAQIRKKMPLRWLCKDLAGLYFSSMEIGLTQRDILRFIKIYFDMPLKDIFSQKTKLLACCSARALKLYEKINHR